MSFEVGDVVVITEGTYDCVHGFNDSMVSKIGLEAIIETACSDGYRIDIDGGKWFWCNNCFELSKIEPDDDLLNGLMQII